MGSIYSPIGKPARKAYSLFPVIDEAGKGFEYIDELLRASFYDGINIGEDEYLQSLVTSLDLDWSEIQKEGEDFLGNNIWNISLSLST